MRCGWHRYIQRRADELPGGRGKDFLRAHRINGNVESLRKARNKKVRLCSCASSSATRDLRLTATSGGCRQDLHAAYVAWQKLAALYERGPGGTIVLKKTPEDRRREEEERRRAEEAKRAAELKERYGRRRGDDTELDEIDDLLGARHAAFTFPQTDGLTSGLLDGAQGRTRRRRPWRQAAASETRAEAPAPAPPVALLRAAPGPRQRTCSGLVVVRRLRSRRKRTKSRTALKTSRTRMRRTANRPLWRARAGPRLLGG